jgi:autotransporter-associated beta strand protein
MFGAAAWWGLLSAASAQTTYSWDAGGANTSWGTASNWVGDVVPTFNTNALLVFDTNVGTADTLFLGAQRQIRGITFGANLTGGADNVFDIQTRTTSGGATVANLLFNGGATNASITLDANTTLSRVRLGSGNVGAISFQTTTDLFHNSPGTVLQFDGSTTGAGSLNKHGIGTVTFTRANSFNGLNLYGGSAVVWSSAAALGTNSVKLGETGSSGNVSLFVGNTLTYTNAITVSSGSGTRVIGNTDVTNQLSGFTAITGNPTLSGGIDLSAGKDLTLAITNYGATTDRLTLSGAITGTGGLIKTGNGVLVFSNSGSTYSGGTVIEQGNIQTTATNSFSSASVLKFGATTNSRRLQLQGRDQTLGGVDDTAATGGILIVEAAADNVSNAPATLTLDVATGTNHTFSGYVRNAAGTATNSALTLIKNGAGLQVLAGATGLVNYSGGTTVNAGVLEFAGANSVANNSAITLGGGTVRFSGGGTRSSAINGTGNLEKTGANTLTLSGNNTFTGGTLISVGTLQFIDGGAVAGNITNNAVLLFNRSDSATVSNAISGAGALIKEGAGTVTLAGSNSYRGNTTIAAGKLVIDGSNTNSTVIVQSGGALGGSGAVGATTIRSGGTIAPGEAEPGQSPMYQNAVAADAAIWPTVNWASFDQDKVVSFGNFQYAVYWDDDRVLTVVRRNLSSNEVQQVRLTDYVLADGLATSEQSNGHRNAVIGLSPLDGRIHLAWDHHNNSLNYTRSRTGLITDPPATITAADFEPKQPIAGAPARVTYPAFLSDHQDNLMFLCRSGGSGSGDIVFFEYDAATGQWTVVAKRLFGSTGTYAAWNNSTSRNAYLHDILSDGNGRLHVSWVWREAAATWASNHDLNYAYSDDRGRTWKNNAGAQIADATRGEQITIDSPGIIVWPIPVYSWLMNQCGMTLDSRNNPHVATYHMEEVLVPATVAHDPPPAERWRLNYYHYWRDDDGVWHRRGPLPKPASANRPVIVAAPDDTIIIYFRTADGIMAHAASARSGWTDWRTHVMTGPEYTYLDASKPDRRRLKESNILSLTADPNALTGGPRGFAFLDFPLENFTRSPEQYGTTGAFDAPAGLVLEEGARLSLRVNSAVDYSFVTSGSIDLRGEVHVHLGRDYAPRAGDTFAFLRGPLAGDVAWVLPSLESAGLKWEEGVGEARGTLSISSLSDPDPPDAFGQWADHHGLLGADRDENADPDGDGLSNLREYAFGGNPVAPDTEAWLVSQDAANLVFSWLQRADSSLSYTLLEHGDLVAGPWLPSVVPIEPATGPAPPPGYGWVRISVPADGKKFFRVQATKPQP